MSRYSGLLGRDEIDRKSGESGKMSGYSGLLGRDEIDRN
jgi:hypothetical protein